MDTIQALKQCGLFSSVGDKALEDISGWARQMTYEPGAPMFDEGQSAEELYVVQEGRVAVQMTLRRVDGERARRITIDVATKNEVIGWSAIVEPHKYTFAAVCTQRAVVLAITADKLRRLLREDSRTGYEVLKALTRVIADRLDETRRILISERLLADLPTSS
jgi:CRP/FNR family cyclic AMP-dependent transcriptional regulator